MRWWPAILFYFGREILERINVSDLMEPEIFYSDIVTNKIQRSANFLEFSC